MLLLATALAGELPSIDAPPTGLTKDLTADVALILAIEDYPALPDVAGAEANARAWAAYLKARGATVKLLVDGEVTREMVLGTNGALGAAGQVRGLRKAGGKVWVVFIGHGAPGDGSGALVGWDAQRTSGSIEARSIGQEELLVALGRDAAVPIVAVVDACFAGRTGAGELAPGVMPARGVKTEAAAQEDTTILVAARTTEYAGPWPGLGRPAFSWLALGALRGWGDEDGDGEVTAQEVSDWTLGRLVEGVNDRVQTPEVFGVTSRALARGNEVAPDLVVARAAVPLVQPGRVGSLGDDSDLLGDVDATVATLRAAEVLKAQLKEARERELSVAVMRAQAQAKDTWAKLAPLRDIGGAEAEAKMKAYVAKYAAAKVEYVDAEGSWSRTVAVAEIKEAEAWLGRGGSASGRDWVSPSLGTMRWIPAGGFTMGKDEGLVQDSGNLGHDVTLTRGFLLMEHEVTQGEWERVTGENPVESRASRGRWQTGPPCALVGVGADLPVVCVTWLEAVAFANGVSRREGLRPAYRVLGRVVARNVNANGYRLPTEAEWEYAARGGEKFRYAGGEDVCEVGNVANDNRVPDYIAMAGASPNMVTAECDDGVSGLAPTGRYRANGYHLSDMSGNALEWVWDRYADPSGEPTTDPSGPSSGRDRVNRGGGWTSGAWATRVTSRRDDRPWTHHSSLGLRLARSVP